MEKIITAGHLSVTHIPWKYLYISRSHSLLIRAVFQFVRVSKCRQCIPSCTVKDSVQPMLLPHVKHTIMLTNEKLELTLIINQ